MSATRAPAMPALPALPAVAATDAGLSELQARFSAALHSTGRAWRQAIDNRLKDLGVSQAAWMTIAMVAKAATPPSQKQLADLLGVEGPTIVAMIDRLVAAHMVERIASPTDRRVKLIALTDAGRALYAQVKERADLYRGELLARFDAGALLAATELLEQLQAEIGEVA